MSEAPYPPAEQPADGDRTAPVPPRYAASASVPVPPAGPPPAGPASFSSAPGPGGATYGGMPGSPFGQAAPYPAPAGQPPASPPPLGQPPLGQPPSGQMPQGQAPLGQPPVGSASVGSASVGSAPVGQPASGQARVAGSASVPGPPVPSTYGSGQQFGSAPPPATYGAASGGTYGSAPPSYAPPSPPGQYGQGSSGGGQYESPGSSPGGTYGSGGGYGGPGSSGGSAGGYGSPGASYGSGSAATFGPTSGDGDRSVAALQRKPRRGLIVALIVTAVLVVVAVGGYVGISLKRGDTDYSVGKCVQQNGTQATVVDCSTAGAYKIVSSVDSESACTDAKQPWLAVTDPTGSTTYRCLAPAASS